MKINTIAIAVFTAILGFSGIAAEDHHVVFIHGLNSSAENWKHMAQLLHGNNVIRDENWLAVDYSGRTSLIGCSGVGGIFWEIFHWTHPGMPVGYNQPIEGLAIYCSEEISEYKKKRGAKKLDFVVHSMGGLILRTMVRDELIDPSEIGQIITLATPHYGQDNISLATQVNQMDYGSEFMWNLAANDAKFPKERMLCIVGDGDHIVDYYAAVFNGASYIKYVDKSHCATPLVEDAPAICECDDDYADEVLSNVSLFILTGKPSGQGRSVSRNKDRGGIMLQVVDGKGNAVSYPNSLIVTKAESTGIRYTAMDFTDENRLNNLSPDNSKNRGIVYLAHEESHGLYKTGGLKPGQYKFTFSKSKDKTFTEFTTEKSYEILDGRTTVVQIPAENTKPLDFVFLIDSTGSMGSSINSVKNNAKRLIEEKLSNGARNCRVAIADYRDYPMYPYGDSGDYVFKLRCGFTTNATTAISALNTITANGGADTPEAVYSALANAIGMDWRTNAVKTIMLMCDAGPHDPEPWAPYYTKSEIIEMAKTLKVDEEDTESGIDDTYADTTFAKMSLMSKRLLAAKNGESGIIGGVSIYPVLTSSSSSLRSTFEDLAAETEGKVIDTGSYSSVADAVGEVIEQSVAANGFETEIVTVRETAGSVSVRVFGGSTADAASIGYQVVSGSGVNGKDFTAIEGIQRLTWAEGERSYKTITIPVTEDTDTSNDKFFSIILCEPSNMGLGSINVCRINLLDKDNTSGEYRMGDVYVQGISRNTEMGSVSGSGFIVSNATVSLTANAKSGYVFTSWENGSMVSCRNITVAEAESNAVNGVATYTASFVSLENLPLPTIISPSVVTGVIEETFVWRLNYDSMSEATVSCSGLPPDFVFTNGVVCGTPTRIGSRLVTFIVKNVKGETSMPVMFEFVCNPQKSISYAIKYANTKNVGNLNPVSYTIEDEIVFAPLSDVEGWKFTGWQPASISRGSTGDITVSAQWSEIKPELGKGDYRVAGDELVGTAPENAASVYDGYIYLDN
ncbi:MAG: VWA domain-containing protein, partial [Kiritimatiellae bacterium]|nr:VWA domain-containing protein [Kiritimatiellia bacterium]